MAFLVPPLLPLRRSTPLPTPRPTSTHRPRPTTPVQMRSTKLSKLALATTLALSLTAPTSLHALPTQTPHQTASALPSPSPLPTSALPVLKVHHKPVIHATHQPLRERLAHHLRARGLTDPHIVYLISALPVVELRGGIPVGYLLKVPPLQTFILAILGNLTPLLPILFLLQIPPVQQILHKVLDRARAKAANLGSAGSRTKALALFVAIPLPGTGAWTGALVGVVLGMSVWHTFAALSVGVCVAAVIVTCLCELGKVGAFIAGCVLISFGVLSIFNGRHATEGESS